MEQISQLPDDLLDFLLSLHNRFGDIAYADMLGHPWVAVFAPALVNDVLSAPEQFIEKSVPSRTRLADETGIRGIISAREDEHRMHRKVVIEAFSKTYLERYQCLIQQIAAHFLEHWNVEGEIDLVPEVFRLSKHVACKLMFGCESSSSAELINAFDAISWQLDYGDYNQDAARQIIAQLRSIDQLMCKIESADPEIDPDSLGLTLWALGRQMFTEQWNISDVRDNLIQLYMTGYDTTACAIVWAFYLLGRHRRVYEKLSIEVRKRLGSSVPIYADFANMPYLDSVVKETLRLYPTGPYAVRSVKKDYSVGGHILTAGSSLIYSPWVTHRIAAFYPEPEAFIPERFGQGIVLPASAYMPFGHGIRSCIGAGFALIQIKTILAMLLQHYQLEISPGQTVKPVSRTAVHLTPGLKARITNIGQTAPHTGNQQ